jgi:glycosyltransferase involved in cell wall biosynthesis
VESALGQHTDFPFNIIVVDNHSSDGTTGILDGLAKRHCRVKHIIPGRTDLGIGGCWNEAAGSPFCGHYAVQLDSDDLYGHTGVLERIVDAFHHDGDTAMVIGSYTIVSERLEEIPPGLIDHREWTDDNGRNNALRINGLGAPRAFRTDLIRRIGFPNVSYGEDYAVALRLSREYRIRRIYDSLYLCRRWAGNTDAALSVETANRFDAYKDKLRTLEILARRKMNRKRKTSPPFEKGGLGGI